MLFHPCNGFKGWHSFTQVGTDWCLHCPKERKQDSTHVVLRNTTGSPIILRKGQKVARVQAANEVPCPHLKPGTLESLETPEDRKPTLSVEECKEKLMTTLDLSGLDQWPDRAGWDGHASC